MLYAEHPMTHIPTGFLTAGKPMPGAQYIFGTRAEGNIGALTERLGPVAHMQQVHGNRVSYATGSGLYEDCDALYTDHDNLWLAVKTADCAPVLISSPVAVAAVHAGWRGLQAEIIPHTIQVLCDEFGQTPEDLHMALGPCLTQKHFEVESTFRDYFDVPHAERFFTANRPGHVLMDFPGLIRAQALAAGILDIHFHGLNRCTFDEGTTFHSYRRDKQEAGRQISLIRKLAQG